MLSKQKLRSGSVLWYLRLHIVLLVIPGIAPVFHFYVTLEFHDWEVPLRSSLGQVMTAFQMTNRCSLRIRDNTNCAQGRVREATLRQSHHISQVFSYKRDSGPICGAQTQTKKDLVQVNTIVSSCENVFGNLTVYVICTKDIICLLPWLAWLCIFAI